MHTLAYELLANIASYTLCTYQYYIVVW